MRMYSTVATTKDKTDNSIADPRKPIKGALTQMKGLVNENSCCFSCAFS